ncbi:hypothetical protein [Haloprofundus halobius]|uniref:hypothetical protein n=1 Tax=Haloprofundus halobius TaxID=2876194 RepID=UPI001CCD6F1F|nr:hypothetical protein [Haloprofundus halobius]
MIRVERDGREWLVVHNGVEVARDHRKRIAEDEAKRLAQKFATKAMVSRANGGYHREHDYRFRQGGRC